jgi:hypothetical protein
MASPDAAWPEIGAVEPEIELAASGLQAAAPRRLPEQVRMSSAHAGAPPAVGGPGGRPGETVFYNSAKARRTWLGRLHYCVSCPGWNKVTNVRVVYSRWEKSSCLGVECLSGRQLDQFDTDLIIDMSAHQNLMQVCRGEGDILVHRLPGDASDPSPTFVISDVPRVIKVFQELTFELASMNLKNLAGKGLGQIMGAVTWDFPAGHDGAPIKRIDKSKEVVYYDSRGAGRTWIGWCLNADCFCVPEYKITSERVIHTEWDWWFLGDDPAAALCCPCVALRAVVEDLCCCGGGGGAERLAKARKLQKSQAQVERGCCSSYFAVPVGRTIAFFDMDIVIDVGAHQRCSQLLFNEGDLEIHRSAPSS